MDEPYRILLIEDSPTQSERLRALFAREGWQVRIAASAEDALAELHRALPDLIVVDYHLPGMQGDEFCRDIRMNVNTRGIPVLMLTVDGTYDAETHGLESGADDYLAKSVDRDILLLRVRALLRKSNGPGAVPARAETFLGRARLLAIDDSPTYLQYLVQELASENYLIEKACSGREALERARSGAFDCVLVDLEMPDLDGIEVCRRLAELRHGMENPAAVLMLTAYEDKQYMTRGLEAGADDFVGKSSDPTVLKARIRALLRRKFFTEDNRRIQEELRKKELETVRARAETEAAQMRARMAEELARTNRELEQANRHLQEALDVTRAITENTAEALFLTDGEGRITFLNPAAERMFGVSQRELLGRLFHERIRCRAADRSACPLMQSLANGATLTSREDVLYRSDGEAVEVAWSSAPILQAGRVTAMVLAMHDISEQKRAEERLRQAQKLESIGLLAGGIAHDFNNILTTIIGTASMVADDLPPAEALRIGAILHSAEKAANLTRQLLAYAGKGQFVIECLDLSAVVREMLALVRLSIAENVECRLVLDNELPWVAADPGQMQQVVMNLVINAAEAIGTGDGGLVTISTGVVNNSGALSDAAGNEIAPGRYVYLEVSDTGCGMDEALRSRIFDPFFTTKFTGRGLGLAAVAGIVRSQNGAITIESEPGAGSTFRVLFPVTEGSGGEAEAAGIPPGN